MADQTTPPTWSPYDQHGRVWELLERRPELTAATYPGVAIVQGAVSA